MRFQQLKGIYQYLLDIHQGLNSLYLYFLSRIQDERPRLFLHFVIENQHKKFLHLKTLLHCESDHVLKAWLDENIEQKLLIISDEQKKMPRSVLMACWILQ